MSLRKRVENEFKYIFRFIANADTELIIVNFDVCVLQIFIVGGLKWTNPIS